MKEKETLRHQIDEIDREMLKLLNKRLTLARAVGEVKIREGAPKYDFKREENLLASLEHLNHGPLENSEVRSIYKEIISASRRIQGPPLVSYLGPAATFSHLAALKMFGHSAKFEPEMTIHDCFIDVEKGNCNFGVVPVENSTAGAVNETLDHLVTTPVKICGEVFLKISHDLASVSGKIAEIEVIYTHPQTRGQCRRWLSENLPEVPIVEMASNAQAAQKAAKNPNSAAIVSSSAAEYYELKIAVPRIEDTIENTTRFFVIGNEEAGPTGSDCTSFLFTVDDVSGALHRALNPLHSAGINMTKIASHPARTGPWKYLFFVDVDGHKDEPKIKAAIDEMERLTSWFKILGSFPRSS